MYKSLLQTQTARSVFESYYFSLVGRQAQLCRKLIRFTRSSLENLKLIIYRFILGIVHRVGYNIVNLFKYLLTLTFEVLLKSGLLLIK